MALNHVLIVQPYSRRRELQESYLNIFYLPIFDRFMAHQSSKKNFGPNVRYYFLGYICALSFWSTLCHVTSHCLDLPLCNFHSFFPIILSCSNDQKVEGITGTLVQWTRKTMQNQIPKHNTLHWDRNSKFPLFCHQNVIFIL